MTSRNTALDATRGIAILLVLIGHTASGLSLAATLIYSFHMPLFFVISGYVFKPIGMRDAALRGWHRLIIPYLIIGFSCAVPALIFGDVKSWHDFFVRVGGTLYSMPRSDLTFYCTPIWFLTCLFCVEVMYAGLSRLSSLRRHCMAVISLLVGWWLFSHAKGYYPWNIQIALVGLFFYHLGSVFRQAGIYERKIPSIVLFILLPVLLFGVWRAVYLNPMGVNLAAMQTGFLAPFLASSILGSLAVFALGKLLSSVRLLGLLGTHTLILFGYNYWVMRFGHFIALDKYGWIASLIVQAPLYFALLWLSRRTGFLSSPSPSFPTDPAMHQPA